MMMQYRTHVSNVLVIGTGAAGLRAAIAAHEAGCDVVLVGKSLKRDAHTVLAAGGINAALGTVDPEDSWQQHFADTLKEGYFLADPLAVEIMAREAPRAIEELVDYGCPFARTETGELQQARREHRRRDVSGAGGRLPACRHGARAVSPHRYGLPRRMGRDARDGGRARRGWPPLKHC